MDIKRPAFTIIELVVAMAIVALLMAVAIPQLTGFSRTQDFATRAQKLADCIQDAQQSVGASATDESAQFSSVTLTPNADTVVCTINKYGSLTKTGDAITMSSLKTHQSDSAIVPLVGGTSGIIVKDITIENPLRIYFSAAERGVPILSCSDFGDSCVGTEAKVLGDGFLIPITVTDTTSAGTSSGIITINSSGNSITYATN